MTGWHSPSRALLAAVVAALVTTGLATAAVPDKSGGSTPVKLTLVDSNGGGLAGLPAVQRFVDRVRELSGGLVTIEVKSQYPDNHPSPADFEQRVVRDVRANTYQLAWVGTRVWDTVGVGAFRALHAPMLVDSYALERAVLQSELPRAMLPSLDKLGLTGLAVLGDNLRYAAGVRQLRSPADFKGIGFRTVISATQAAAARALGARPSGLVGSELDTALRAGQVSALETDLNAYQDNAYAGTAPYVTLNLVLWPRPTVLFANTAALASLSDEQRGWIEQAARDAAAYSLMTFDEDQKIVPSECTHGMRVVFASPAQLQAFRRAFAPVHATLRRDAATAQAMDAILALKKQVRATQLTAPKSCRVARTAAAETESAGTFPEGVYRFKRTREDLVRLWPNVNDLLTRALVATATFTFRNNAVDLTLSGGGIPGCRHISGRYTVNGQFLTHQWTKDYGCGASDVPSRPLRLRWSREGTSLRFKVVGAASPLDRTPWETNTLVRVGG